MPVKIDRARFRSGQRLDCRSRSSRDDAIAADRQRLDVRMRRIAGKDFAVDQHRIGRAAAIGGK
jgi:hypothetical protein